MNLTIKKYISTILLLAVALEVTTLGFIHHHDSDSHENHSHKNVSHLDSSHHDNDHALIINGDSIEEACALCEIQHALNNQSFLLNEEIGLNHFTYELKYLSISDKGNITSTSKINSGRAPPLS